MAAGVHQSHTQNKGPKLPLGVICPLHNPPWGATTAGTTTKCQSKPLNNKRHRKKLISVTHVAICKPPRAPSCAPTLSLNQPAVFATVIAPPVYKLLSGPSSNSGVQVGLWPHILPLYPLQWEVGVSTPSPPGLYLQSKETWKTWCTPRASWWVLGTQPLDPPRPLQRMVPQTVSRTS